jgi:hypothetical protein
MILDRECTKKKSGTRGRGLLSKRMAGRDARRHQQGPLTAMGHPRIRDRAYKMVLSYEFASKGVRSRELSLQRRFPQARSRKF